MKILKPGKIEQRKFVCNKCGCVFVATEQEKYLAHDDYYQPWMEVQCPCGVPVEWDNGEPYEEPTPTQELDEVQKLMKVIEKFNGDLSRISYSNVALIRFCKHLIANGVTFREG